MDQLAARVAMRPSIVIRLVSLPCHQLRKSWRYGSFRGRRAMVFSVLTALSWSGPSHVLRISGRAGTRGAYHCIEIYQDLQCSCSCGRFALN